MKAVDKIDWELLDKQRKILNDMLTVDDTLNNKFTDKELEQYNALVGVVNLLDEMSDEKYFSDKVKKITDKFGITK